MVRAAGATHSCSTPPGHGSRWPSTTSRELRYRALANTDPAEAERLHGLAEEAVAQRWDVYEEMAARGAAAFPADARKDG